MLDNDQGKLLQMGSWTDESDPIKTGDINFCQSEI